MVLIAFAMVFSMAGVVSADDTQMSHVDGDTTNVNYDVADDYGISIPPSGVTLVETNDGYNSAPAYSVGVSYAQIPEDKVLSIRVSSQNNFHVLATSGNFESKVKYHAGIPDDNGVYSDINNDAEVLRIGIGDDYSTTMKFYTTDEERKKAKINKTHNDYLTFTYGFINPEDVWDGTVDTSWYNDVDTEFTLTTAEQFAGFAKLVDDGNTFEGKTIKLGVDIDLYLEDEEGEPICFDPIGSYKNEKPFKGTFYGNGNTISGLSQNTWALDNGYYYSDCGLGLFGAVEDATIKNLNIDGADISGESAICGVIAGVSSGKTTFENIKISNANCADYQYYAGGIVGYADGEQTFVNCHVDSSNNIAAQWGDFDNSIGGVIGGASTSAEILMKDCIVECRIDAYNDVTSTYGWCAYRRAGMLIGNSEATETVDGNKYASAPQLTCENVKVIYGDWANYHYCEFTTQPIITSSDGKTINPNNWPYVRCEEGVSTSAYYNPRYGVATDSNGDKIVNENGEVNDNHVHNEGEDHNILYEFDQLYGGGQGVYGTATHEGVIVEYNNK